MNSQNSTLVLLYVAAAVYFRATITADRNVRRFQQDGPNEVTDRALFQLKSMGPVKFFDRRVVLSAIVVCLPLIVASTARWNEISMLIALGAFISPLNLPSGPLDLKSPARFFAQWLLRQADQNVKLAVLLGFCYLVVKIPALAWFARWSAGYVFPVIPGAGAELFADCVAVLMVLMYVVRLTQLAVHGPFFLVTFAAAICVVWVTLQYEANEVLKLAPLASNALVVFAVKSLIDLLNDLGEALIDY
jgi:hypothetical protein